MIFHGIIWGQMGSIITRNRPLFESGTISAGSSMLGTKTDGIIIQELRKSWVVVEFCSGTSGSGWFWNWVNLMIKMIWMCDSDWWIKRMCVVRTVLPPELPELPDPDPFEPDPVSDPESDPEPDPDPPPPPPITIESSLFKVSFILLSMKILVSKSYKNVSLKNVCIQNWPKSAENGSDWLNKIGYVNHCQCYLVTFGCVRHYHHFQWKWKLIPSGSKASTHRDEALLGGGK